VLAYLELARQYTLAERAHMSVNGISALDNLARNSGTS
jgi:phospholipase C